MPDAPTENTDESTLFSLRFPANEEGRVKFIFNELGIKASIRGVEKNAFLTFLTKPEKVADLDMKTAYQVGQLMKTGYTPIPKNV